MKLGLIEAVSGGVVGHEWIKYLTLVRLDERALQSLTAVQGVRGDTIAAM